MPMLSRYRKPGGFLQLLSLIETCTPEKREKLLKVIEGEDRGWAALLINKMLSVDKILKWPPNVLVEVTTQLPQRTLAILLKDRVSDLFDRATQTMSHFQKKELEVMIEELQPTPGERHAAGMKLIQKVRELDTQGTIKLHQVDPELDLEEFKHAA